MTRRPAVYILASRQNGTLYIGVTSNPVKRIWQHKNDLVEGVTKRYRVHQLVHFEQYDTMDDAILREIELKKWNRSRKIRLIGQENQDWDDLCRQIAGKI